MRPNILLPLVLGAALTDTGNAYQPLVTDDTGTQGKGGNQVEVGVNRDREDSAGDVTTTHTLPLTYTLGLSDSLDVFVDANHARVTSSIPGTDAIGSGNPSLGLKWRFYEKSTTSLAIKPELMLPVNLANESAGLGAGRSSYQLALILTQETSFGAIHANLVAGRSRYRETTAGPRPDTTLTSASIAPVWGIGTQWKLALDVGAERTSSGGGKSRSNFVEIGALHSPSEDLDVAFGILRRSRDGTPNAVVQSLTAGITWRFK